jgi:hypothetical protein
MANKMTPGSNMPLVEDFWVPADDRMIWPRTQEDIEFGDTAAFVEELYADPNIVGRARHEPSRPVEDISSFPKAYTPVSVTPSALAKVSRLIAVRPPTEE